MSSYSILPKKQKNLTIELGINRSFDFSEAFEVISSTGIKSSLSQYLSTVYHHPTDFSVILKKHVGESFFGYFPSHFGLTFYEDIRFERRFSPESTIISNLPISLEGKVISVIHDDTPNCFSVR
jgi:hypothetical protein